MRSIQVMCFLCVFFSSTELTVFTSTPQEKKKRVVVVTIIIIIIIGPPVHSVSIFHTCTKTYNTLYTHTHSHAHPLTQAC